MANCLLLLNAKGTERNQVSDIILLPCFQLFSLPIGFFVTMASKQLRRGTPPLPKVHQVVANHCLSDVYLKELQADQQTILQPTSSSVQFRIIPALLERGMETPE